MRVLAGVGAWLVGVGAATACSLLAVSLLGQGIATGTRSQQLTAVAVNRALAAEASESPGPAPVTTSAPGPAPSATRSHQAQASPTTRPQTGATPSVRASRSRPVASPGTQPTASPSAQPTAVGGPASTVLTSPGGTVVADCRPGGAYLVSWSPVPGYESGAVIRGPAVTARVTFNSAANSVTMVVSCSTGVPTATTTTGGGGGDDGGRGDE
jgi:hypothetical protein